MCNFCRIFVPVIWNTMSKQLQIRNSTAECLIFQAEIQLVQNLHILPFDEQEK